MRLVPPRRARVGRERGGYSFSPLSELFRVEGGGRLVGGGGVCYGRQWAASGQRLLLVLQEEELELRILEKGSLLLL